MRLSLYSLFIVSLVFIGGCQQLPSNDGCVVSSYPFKHRLVDNAGETDYLTIYIEGDGRPWRSRYKKAEDPSSNQPSLYSVMLKDTGAALYLGRPCYFNTEDKACSSLWWTEKRYSQPVIDSMYQVVLNYSADYKSIRFIGHSGGATLAALLAEKVGKTRMLVTIAGNMDIASWTQYHGYSSLSGSVNPIDQPALKPEICQLHVIAGKDETILPEWINAYSAHQAGPQIYSLTLSNSRHNGFNVYWREIKAAMQQCQTGAKVAD